MKREKVLKLKSVKPKCFVEVTGTAIKATGLLKATLGDNYILVVTKRSSDSVELKLKKVK